MAEASWLKEKAASKPSEWTHARTAPPRSSKTSSGGGSSDDVARRKLREMNKRMRTIYEDDGVDYGEEDVDEKEIIDRFKVAVKIRKNSIATVMQEIKRARNVDLCFMVDATGSMQPHIDEVRTKINEIVDYLTGLYPSKHVAFSNEPGIVKSLRLAFVAYRDHGDTNQFEVLDFIESTTSFRSFCARIYAQGGDDGPEDVFGGLDKMLQLSWSPNSGTKVVFHIADAPCHGQLFHNLGRDNYPGGDPKGRTHTALFDTLREQGIQYHFGKINSSTDKMMEMFSRAYGEMIIDFDVKDVDKITSSVISAVSTSVSSSISISKATGGVKHKKRPFTIDPAKPDWSREATVEGRFITYEHPASINDIIEDIPLVRKESKKALVQIAKNPFAQGSERIAYYGRDVTYLRRAEATPPSSERRPGTILPSSEATETDIVLKEYKFVGKGSNTASRYEITNQLQTIASYLAIGFTKELQRRSPDMRMEIKFLKIKTLATETMRGKFRFMSCEKCFTRDDVFLRFSNNTDYGMLESKAKEKGVDVEYVQMLMAFSHWTYQVSKTRLMVVDLQGIITQSKTGGRKVLLTDPAIHCKDPTLYGQMNHAKTGMENFFSRHECNDFCRKLSLKSPAEFSDVSASSRASSSKST